MLFLRFKQAEIALAEGRLDEAFELLQDEQFRNHQRGQKLIGRLTQALVKRGREHLEAQRLSQALTDCSRADKLSGNLSEVAELHGAVARAVLQQQNSQHRQGKAVAQAREHIDNGRLSAVENLLSGESQNNHQAVILMREAADRRDVVDAAIIRIENALQREDWQVAVSELLQAQKYHHAHQRLIDLNQQVTSVLVRQVKSALVEGRLDRAGALAVFLEPLVEQSLELRELQQTVRQLRRAYEYLENGQPQPAGDILRRLAPILPGTKWLDDAIKQTEQIATANRALHTGPLGLLGVVDAETDNDNRVEKISVKTDKIHPARSAVSIPQSVSDVLPSSFLIQVDGVGSFPVFREARVTLGPISSSQRPDLGLIADPELPVATIERTEEDYFVRTSGQIFVNDKIVNQRLLADGDKLALSPRCRLTFRRPNAASTSALLDLSGARMTRPDIRSVLLLDQEFIIGASPSAHIRADRVSESVVLYLNRGRLFCRSKSSVKIGDEIIDRSIGLVMNKPIKIGELSFVLTKL